MPSAVPRDAAAHLPPARLIDPRGHRFGAAVSGTILVASALLGQPLGVAFVLITIGVSAAFGMRWSIYGAIWRRLARGLRLPAVEPEHEYPPRFAQTLGSIALLAALVAFGLGATVVGWVFSLAVAALQALLALTGYCLGCRLYFLRWWLPSAVTRLWSRGAGARSAGPGTALRYR
ncbi:MAG TPA: DUF4395 domain-containing protein [Candidatus Binatia bacterium]|nr:DUF4395 domain-containing protein [Candidatus Binatia bacterium]